MAAHALKRSFLGGLTLGLWLIFGLSTGAAAEGFAYDLAAELMSPYCPGRTLASCPSPQASELIQWISMQEAAGASEDEVVEMLIEQFGEEILAAPPAEGITLWAYVFPIAGFLGGGGVVVFSLRSLVGGRTEASSGVGSSREEGAAEIQIGDGSALSQGDAELAKLVDAELAERG